MRVEDVRHRLNGEALGSGVVHRDSHARERVRKALGRDPVTRAPVLDGEETPLLALTPGMAYGQSKSGWYRYAATTMMTLEPMLNEIYERYQYEGRKEMIQAAIKKEDDRRKREVGNGNG